MRNENKYYFTKEDICITDQGYTALEVRTEKLVMKAVTDNCHCRESVIVFAEG
jgi:hypothetical protein